MALSKPQQTIVQDGHRFRVVSAGRRFGKTHLLTRELAYHARLPDQRVWAIYPSFRMAKQILWKKLKKRLLELNWVKGVNESDLTIMLVNGSEISLRSADNPDSLRGVGLNFVAFDEFADMDATAWTEVIRPTLSDTNGRALFVGTPKGFNHFKEIYDNAKADPANWASFSYTTVDGGRVSAEEVEAAKRDLDERTFRQEYLASFETFTGRIAYNFTEDNIKNIDPKNLNLTTVYVGCDFNVSPITAAIMARHGDDLYVIDEIYMHNSNTQEMADEIRRRYPKTIGTDSTTTNRIEVFPDPAGSARKTSAGGATDHNILANAGFVVRAPRAHTPVKDRINAINSRLCSTDGKRHLFVNPKCRNTLNSLEKYCYKEGTQVPDKDSGWDHMFDAVSYAVDYMFPLRRNVEPQPAQRWGHQVGYQAR
jgi:phage terminase large subunit